MTNFQYTGSINPNRQIYDPSAGMAQAAPSAYAKYGAQSAFDNNYRAAGQQAAMDLGREATQAQNQYFGRAADSQNRGALRGLGLLSEQNDALESMRYKWLNDMMSGNPLGGLM